MAKHLEHTEKKKAPLAALKQLRRAEPKEKAPSEKPKPLRFPTFEKKETAGGEKLIRIPEPKKKASRKKAPKNVTQATISK